MAEKILQYREVRRQFGVEVKGESLYPKPGEMFVYYDEASIPQGCKYICPCGCGQQIYTPVTPASQPKRVHHWQLRYDPDGLTILPSVRWTGGCYAHFNITNGRTVFHGDSGVKPPPTKG